MLKIKRGLEAPNFVLKIDDSSEWCSTVKMWISLLWGEDALLAYATKKGYPNPLTQDDFRLGREIVGVSQPLVDVSDAMQADISFASQTLPFLYSLQDDYGGSTTVQVPRRGCHKERRPISTTDLLAPSSGLLRKFRDDIHLNMRHLVDSRPTLIMCTAIDQRLRLRALGRWLDADELRRARDAIVQESLQIARGAWG